MRLAHKCLQAIRVAVANLPIAAHFHESALGFRLTAETEVHDATLRTLWETEGGRLRAAKLEKPGFPRLELYQWEGCTGEPIRDPLRPWDFGVRELLFHTPDLASAAGELERRHRCHFLDGETFISPLGDRCRLVNGNTSEAAALTVPSLADAAEFLDDLRLEASEMRRLADPRKALETAPRMSPRYTGVWMLTASTPTLPPDDARIVDVEIPFVGRRRAIVGRAPGGVRFGLFENKCP